MSTILHYFGLILILRTPNKRIVPLFYRRQSSHHTRAVAQMATPTIKTIKYHTIPYGKPPDCANAVGTSGTKKGTARGVVITSNPSTSNAFTHNRHGESGPNLVLLARRWAKLRRHRKHGVICATRGRQVLVPRSPYGPLKRPRTSPAPFVYGRNVYNHALGALVRMLYEGQGQRGPTPGRIALHTARCGRRPTRPGPAIRRDG